MPNKNVMTTIKGWYDIYRRMNFTDRVLSFRLILKVKMVDWPSLSNSQFNKPFLIILLTWNWLIGVKTWRVDTLDGYNTTILSPILHRNRFESQYLFKKKSFSLISNQSTSMYIRSNDIRRILFLWKWSRNTYIV
jgi:hypothetical protein